MKENVGVGREKSVALEEAQARSRAQKKKNGKRIGGKELPQEKAKPCNVLGQLARNPSPSVWTSGSAELGPLGLQSGLSASFLFLQVSLKKRGAIVDRVSHPGCFPD